MDESETELLTMLRELDQRELQAKKVRNTLSPWVSLKKTKAQSISKVWRELDQRERELDQVAEVSEELLHLKAELAWVKALGAEAIVGLRKTKMMIVESIRPGGA